MFNFFSIGALVCFLLVLGGCGGGSDGTSSAGGNTVTTSWTGTKQLGGTDFDAGYGVAIDSGGNVYVAGVNNGGLDGNTNAGFDDILLVKYSPTGAKQWTRLLGSSGPDIGNSVAIDSSGNVYVAGLTFGGLDGNTNAGGVDIFLVKYDPTGTKQWTRQLGSSGTDVGQSVAIDSSGNVYVAGHTYGGLDGNTNAGFTDIFLVKYDPAGAKLWTRQLGSSGDDYGHSIAIDSSSNVYVAGSTSGGLDGNMNAGGDDIFLVKYDPTGAKQWTRQLGSITADSGNGVTVDNSGNVYVTGYTYGGIDGNTNAGGSDIFLVKYDPAGAKQWTRQLGSSGTEYGYSVAIDSSGNVYVAGMTDVGLDGNTTAGSYDSLVVKYDSIGSKQWSRQLGSAGTDVACGVAVDASGNAYITGVTDGDLDGNTNAGNTDVFFAKYDQSGVKQ